MRKQWIFQVLISIFYILTSCSEEIKSKPQLVDVTLLSDSVTRLDSLASVLIFKDNNLALKYANTAVELSGRIASAELLARSMNVKGIVLSVNHYDSAFVCFTEALSISGSKKTESEKAHILYNLSQLYDLANDYKNSVILLDSSIQIGLRYQNYKAVTASLIALGNVYYATEDYSNAEAIYDSALRISSRNLLHKEMAVALANLAKFREDPKEARSMLRQAIFLLNHEKGTEEEMVNMEINLGLLQDDTDSAIIYYQDAIDKAKRYHMPVELLGAYNNIAYKYLKKKEIGKSEECITLAIPLALEMKNDDWLSTLYDTYADILIAKAEYRQAILYLRKSIEARAMSDKLISEKHVRILNAILEVKNKNLLIVEKEGIISQKEARINQMYLWLAISGILILMTGFGIFWIKQRGKIKLQRTKLEAARKIIEAGEHEKERNAMELHDAVGALVSKLKEAIRQSMVPDTSARQSMELHINEFKDEIRNVSHRMNKHILERHPIDSLLKSFFDDSILFCKLNLTYVVDKPVKPLNVDLAIHLYRIVQELINNARKHAKDAEIKIIIHFFEKYIEIKYSDNGNGFPLDSYVNKGMGILNIFARVNLINGHAELDSEPGRGVYWKITAPAGYA